MERITEGARRMRATDQTLMPEPTLEHALDAVAYHYAKWRDASDLMHFVESRHEPPSIVEHFFEKAAIAHRDFAEVRSIYGKRFGFELIDGLVAGLVGTGGAAPV